MRILSEREFPGTSRRLLPGTPWSMRFGRASMGRTALELYAGDDLLDVVVPTPLAPGILCGARAGVCDGRPMALAWGVLEAGQVFPSTVVFTRSRLRGALHQEAEAFLVEGSFWLSFSDGRFGSVTVTRSDGGSECHRIRRARR